MPVPALISGGAIAIAAAFVAGFSGFGYALLATPLLLAAGFSLPFIVTVNLLIAALTRTSVAYRLRRRASRRAWLLLVGGAPGLVIGVLLLAVVSGELLKRIVGAIVMFAALSLVKRPSRQHEHSPLTALAAALTGGALSTATSLGGIPLVLLYARERVAAEVFFADFAIYTIGSSVLGLGLLCLTGRINAGALFAGIVWIPGALLVNHLGTSFGLTFSADRFRYLTLSLCFAAGAVAIAVH